MTIQPAALSADLNTLPKLPPWVTSGRTETLDTVAFRSGAALTVLDQFVTDPAHGVPVKLLAKRLALKAATVTSKIEGRLAQETDIRDAFAGDVLRWIEAGADRAKTHGPLAGCVAVMRGVLEVDDRAERIACLLSDIVLARVTNWKTALPVTAQHLSITMLRELVAGGQRADLKVQAGLLISIEDTIRLARDLATRAAALRAVTPRLRAKGSKSAADLFLSEDAIGPSIMLSPTIQGTTIPMTDRVARRFCDRLVELGVAHELTGRPTFRLYGIVR